MSLLIHPGFESNGLEPNVNLSDRIYDRTNIFASEPFRIPAFIEATAHKSNRIYEETNLLTTESTRIPSFIEPNAYKSNSIYQKTNLLTTESTRIPAFTEPTACESNRIHEKSNFLFTESTRTSAFMDIRALNPWKVPTYSWENLNASREPVSGCCESEFSKNLWTGQRPLVESSPRTCKNTEFWRPFSPPPRDEEFQSGCFLPEEFKSGCFLPSRKSSSHLPVITPSTVKIGTSKSSVFEPVKKKKYTCSNCSAVFTNGAQLKSHLRKHKGVKPYRCEYPECPKSFARNEELTRHRRIHSGHKPFRCGECGKCFCRKDHLSKHRTTHLHIAQKRVHACRVPGCEHRYTRSDALARHRSAAHGR